MSAAAAAQAATLTVTTFSDSTTNDSFCSLREAVRAANLNPINNNCGTGSASGNTIVLSAGTYVISQSTPIDVTRTTTIQGVTTWTTTIRADLTALYAIGVIAPSANVTLKNLIFTKGTQNAGVTGLKVVKSPSGQATLSLDHVQVTNFNRTGIVDDCGSLLITYSTIANNSNDENGGGITVNSDFDTNQSGRIVMDHSAVINNTAVNGSGGGLNRFTVGTDNSSITESTFSGNHADIRGGAIFSSGTNSSYLGITHSTFADNSAGIDGGGTVEDGLIGTIQHTANILNDNQAPQAPDIEGNSFAFWCIITQVDGLFTGATDNSRVGSFYNARLAPLMYYGGPTQVRPLTPQAPQNPSPAIDFGDPTDTDAHDQRNYGRPKIGNGGTQAIVDVGAYEYDPAPIIFQSENEPMLAKSTDAYTVVSNASYSGGKGVNLASDAVGDFMTFAVGVVLPGTYNVKVRVKKGSNEGKFQLWKATSLNGTYSTVGTEKDLYNISDSWTELDISSTVSLTQGQAYFKFAVTNKNASSTGRQLFIDYMKFTKL